ncbi:bis(5'-nucleosyl)-tetraphosphatase (symmetrical) YqeK [Scytonema millei]|uniref:bis(5'-nucleosyl)-tetraphosphatase (symmetrical) n=1 Tax=Scytonema millei VB511283 TaxID=1245923 RepID=A0A9X5E3M4_9CYAN|nr:bis(5'-nucleosyl)-tetraphosphatase (symmetrical) YqeK [Scytonema millei]NHC33447.1 HD domain-containing protein [Scytonema millei VB511283]
MLDLNHSSEYTTVKRERVLSWLSEHVPQSRIDHILRVEQMAVELAEHHRQNVEKAAMSGLMHDLAKYFKPAKLLEMARAEGLEIDPVMELHPHLLHADVSAIVARDTFGVQDEEVLQGIANHTLGRPEMTELSCIVFLADSIEPGRGDTPELKALRQMSYQNLSQAVWRTCDYSLKFLIETHCLIHPRTIATRNWFLNWVKSKHHSPHMLK